MHGLAKPAQNAQPMAALTMLREQVAEAVDEGADLHEVEERLIEAAPVAREDRDALWLYAWGLLEREVPSRAQRSPRR